MAVLAPPTVIGPLLATSPLVRVDGVLSGATVTVTALDGTVHADGTATSNGTVVLTVTRTLREGTTLVATQERGADSSGPSVHGCPVIPAPRDLPRPTFEAVLNQCSDSCLLSGLVPGASVTIKRGATVLATQTAETTRQWIRLGTTMAIGTVLTASQSLAGSNPSPPGSSDPVTLLDIENGIVKPTVGEPLTACLSTVDFSRVVATGLVTADLDDGTSYSWQAPGDAFRGLLLAPLRPGAVRVRQQLPACGVTSPEAKVTVGPEQKPPQPRPQAFCPAAQCIVVDDLLAGATVAFSVASWDNNIGGWVPEKPLMVAGAAGGSQKFDLPQVVGGGPGPIVNIMVRQTLCTLTSDRGFAREYIRPGEPSGIAPSAQPSIVAPVYTCAQTVRIDPSGWGIGVLRSRVTGVQLADAFAPFVGLPALVKLWFPLTAGDELVVEYTGCAAPQPTSPVPVTSVPATLPDLTIETPLPGDTEVRVRGALPGARVIATVDGQIRAAVTTNDGTATLALPSALAERQRVGAYQRLCGASGNTEAGVVVRRGALTATCTPAGATTASNVSLTVTAKRTDNGSQVAGLPVQLGGTSVGVTGTPFAWVAPAVGNVPGVVKGGTRYADASFSVAVTAPPPPPTGSTLELRLGGFGGYGSPISVTKVAWRVEPSWGAPAVTGNGPTASVSLPAPPPGTSNPRASVFLQDFAGTRTDGGVAFKLWPDALSPMVIVALTKPHLLVGFLLTTEIRNVLDDNGNIVDQIWVAVIRWQGTA